MQYDRDKLPLTQSVTEAIAAAVNTREECMVLPTLGVLLALCRVRDQEVAREARIASLRP